MSLSYKQSKIIKAKNLIFTGKKTLKINVVESNEEQELIDEKLNEEFIKIEEETKLKLMEANNRYEEIIKAAQEESSKIIELSKSEAANIEKKAYEEGHRQGIKNGYEDGYKEAYEDNIEKAKLEASEIIKEATNTLLESKEYTTNYMKENKKDIIKLSISIAEQVLRKKFTDEESMDEILLNIIDEYELRENFVIRVNPLYKESLDSQIIQLKETCKIKGDVFVLGDESVEQGNAVIDNSKGRLVVGIDTVLDKVKEELL